MPAFTAKARDGAKWMLPAESYESVTLSCSPPNAFDIRHRISGSATFCPLAGTNDANEFREVRPSF